MTWAVYFMLATVIGLAESSTKQWTANTNYDNPDNWDIGRLPCQNDRIKFPDSVPMVYMQANATMVELVLPSDGEIILGDGMTLTFSPPDNSADCPGEDAEFTRTEAKSWFDTDNWCVSDSLGKGCVNDTFELLDTEKVPCKYDNIVFPPGNTYYVDLQEGVDVFMNSLELSGEHYNTGSLRSYLSTSEGRQEFTRDKATNHPTTLNVRPASCSDITGCACGNDQGPLLDKICTTRKDDCPKIECSGGLRPQGHCCDICGAIMELEYGYGFKMKRIKQMIEKEFIQLEDDYSHVRPIVSKLSNDKIQVVLQDNVHGEEAIDMAYSFATKVESDMAGSRRLGINSLHLNTSHRGHPNEIPTPAGRLGQDSSFEAGAIIGIVIAIVIILVIIILVIAFLIRRRSLQPPSFQMFTNGMERNGDLELGTQANFSDPITSEASVRGFDNPMYDSPATFTTLSKDSPSIIETNGVNGDHAGFENPMYDNPIKVRGKDSTSIIETNGVNGDHAGFENPMYDTPIKDSLYLDPAKLDPTIKFNPIYSAEGIEEESGI